MRCVGVCLASFSQPRSCPRVWWARRTRKPSPSHLPRKTRQAEELAAKSLLYSLFWYYYHLLPAHHCLYISLSLHHKLLRLLLLFSSSNSFIHLFILSSSLSSFLHTSLRFSVINLSLSCSYSLLKTISFVAVCHCSFYFLSLFLFYSLSFSLLLLSLSVLTSLFFSLSREKNKEWEWRREGEWVWWSWWEGWRLVKGLVCDSCWDFCCEVIIFIIIQLSVSSRKSLKNISFCWNTRHFLMCESKITIRNDSFFDYFNLYFYYYSDFEQRSLWTLQQTETGISI